MELGLPVTLLFNLRNATYIGPSGAYLNPLKPATGLRLNDVAL